MRLFIMVLLVLLAGCAGNPAHDNQPKIARISPEELDRLVPKPVPNLALDEIVRLSQAGEAPAAIIAKIRDSHSSYVLTPEQLIDLNRKGVSLQVLDYIFNAQQQAIRDSMADEFTQRERKHQTEVDALKRELMMRPYLYDPFWPPYPYYSYPGYHWRR